MDMVCKDAVLCARYGFAGGDFVQGNYIDDNNVWWRQRLGIPFDKSSIM
jgi:hypothetical protein